MNKVALFEFVGLVFDTSIILDDKLEGRCRTSLDKIDRYFYKATSSLIRNKCQALYTFQVNIAVREKDQLIARMKAVDLWLTDLDRPY